MRSRRPHPLAAVVGVSLPGLTAAAPENEFTPAADEPADTQTASVPRPPRATATRRFPRRACA